MAQNLGLLTDMWMVDPTMFDPTQKSNQFSSFNNAPFPFPPTYNPGLAGGPVNAATGQPIQSFQQWQQANPAGVTLNQTPAQPQAPPQPAAPPNYSASNPPPGGSMFAGDPNNPGVSYASERAMSPAMQMQHVFANLPTPGWSGTRGGTDPAAMAQGQLSNAIGNVAYNQYMNSMRPTAPPAAAPQAQGPPNNWMAVLNALANPGNPVTQGANVPLAQGYQPSGGINQAFLQQAQGRPGMNQNFLSALAALQGRPQ